MQKKQILAKRGEILVGEKFQKYLVSLEDKNVITTYMEHNTVKVFDDIDEAFEMIKTLLNIGEYGWYALDYQRWNDKY